MIHIRDRLVADGLSGRMLLQVHDELVLEVPVDEVEAVTKVVKHEMEHAATLSVPLIVDVGTGKNWVDTKR
jgi:DNA polymerase I